jgi:hypothetical protein
MQTRVGQKYCDEAQLLPLLLAQGLVRRVRTIAVEVHPLGGDSIKIRLDVTQPSVGKAKSEIARMQGTEVARQELYRVAVREDGGAVREDDAEPELLDDNTLPLEEGAVITMAVKESPLVWQKFPEDYVELGDGGTVATQISDHKYYYSHVTTAVELNKGKNYWEVEILSENMVQLFVGVTRPNLDPKGCYIGRSCKDGWFTYMVDGKLYGNSKYEDDAAGPYKKGDRVGVLLDLNNGSLLFFKNGVQHGPGYAAGSVTGPVVAAVELYYERHAARLHVDVAFPAGHAQTE